MYYRYEVWIPRSGTWAGVCSVMNPSEHRKVARFLKVPKWYKKHPDTPSTCWFTDYGYKKYHEKIDAIIAEWIENKRLAASCVRLRRQESIGTILQKGRIQCIAEKQ